MPNTIEAKDAVQQWIANYEMIKSFRSHTIPGREKLQDDALEIFKTLGFPTTRHEEWKYTSLLNQLNRDYGTAFMPGRPDPIPETHTHWWSAFDDAIVLVLNNGHYDEGLSSTSEQINISKIGSGTNALIEEQYGTIAPMGDHATVALNTAVAENGLGIEIPRGTVVEAPIFIVHRNNTAAGNLATYSRTFIYAHENSQAKVVELWINEGGNHSFENAVTEVVVKGDANLHHYALQNDTNKSSLVNFLQADQYRNSVFTTAIVSTQGEMIRNNTEIRHKEEHIESHMYGLYMLDGEQHVDNHTLVDHAQPNSFSNELYKGVLDGNSTAVFNGKVLVRQDAQKTNAFQSNKTVLLSDDATINTKPQLEIFADDVKCTHGATTGRLDEEALYYMQSRGISKTKARALLTYAFAAEVLENIQLAPVRDQLEEIVSNRLF